MYHSIITGLSIFNLYKADFGEPGAKGYPFHLTLPSRQGIGGGGWGGGGGGRVFTVAKDLCPLPPCIMHICSAVSFEYE